jgi:AraC family transcriptional regulator
MRVETRQEHHCSLVKLLDGLTQYPESSGSLERLGSMAGFSADHLNRIFRGFTGESVIQFTRRISLERAALELSRGDAGIWQASVRAGYGEPEAFTKAFRKAFGIPPSGFLGRQDADWKLPCESGIHWGLGSAYPPLLQGAEELGIRLETMGPIRLLARPFIGDFVLIPSAWERFRSEITDDLAARGTWATVFCDGGLKAKNRDAMRSYLAVVEDPALGEFPAGFERLDLPGGPFATSRWISGSEEHSLAWTFLNRTWVPKPDNRMEMPGYDLYGRFPTPWEELEARIFLGLQ